MHNNLSINHQLKCSLRAVILVFLLNSVFSILCQASSNKIPDESQIIENILEESKKAENRRNPSVLRLIRDFTYQKLKDYAEKDKEFGIDLSFETDEEQIQSSLPKSTDHVGIISLGEGYLLLTVSTCDIGSEESELYFFLIQNNKSDWIPIQFDFYDEEKGKKSRSRICDTVEYNTPLLKIHSRGAPESCAECGTTDLFLFKDSSFKLVLSVLTDIQPIGLDEAETAPHFTYTHESTYSDKDIIEPCKSNAIPLNEQDLWKNIYFAKVRRVYFHETADETTKKKAYIVNGDAVCASEIHDFWIFATYYNPKSSTRTSGWIRKEDLTNLDQSREFIELMNLLDS